MTYTFVTMEISKAAYEEIAAKMRDAGYDHAFDEDGEIDMHGIALVPVDAERSDSQCKIFDWGALQRLRKASP
jgi:hypothetical protein